MTPALVPVVSHEQKFMSPCFGYFDLTNAMVTLMMPSTSHDADVDDIT